jgi:hypothetical protein
MGSKIPLLIITLMSKLLLGSFIYLLTEMEMSYINRPFLLPKSRLKFREKKNSISYSSGAGY